MSKLEIIAKAVADELERQFQESRAWGIRHIEQCGNSPLAISVDGEIDLLELAHAITNALDHK